MINYETQASREAKLKEAERILADQDRKAADRAAMARLIDRGYANRPLETPAEFLRRIGYTKD